MTGADLKALREQLGLSLLEMGRALGYEQGSRRTVRRLMARYEHYEGPIPPLVEERLRRASDNSSDTE